ncbi:MAG: hypothetical protein KME21_31195 [Desmonostoc vinosum HA7617-LM4]|jgi:hypothetical protein|nr:hypothetical protein [Desmonostoc vinosum HA7617-LM4]
MLATNLEKVDRPDLAVLDKDGQIVLIAEVEGFPYDLKKSELKNNVIWRLIDYLQAATTLVPFAMLVYIENIEIFMWDGKNLSDPILSLNTADILSHYEPDFNNIQVFSLYLTGLTEAWISDLAYHWDSEIPPASKEIADIGLLQRLEGGAIQV